jgi:hypothetical protein
MNRELEVRQAINPANLTTGFAAGAGLMCLSEDLVDAMIAAIAEGGLKRPSHG